MNNLTPREIEVLLYTSMGLKPKEISKEMGVALKTIYDYSYHIYDKLEGDIRPKSLNEAVEMWREYNGVC